MIYVIKKKPINELLFLFFLSMSVLQCMVFLRVVHFLAANKLLVGAKHREEMRCVIDESGLLVEVDTLPLLW